MKKFKIALAGCGGMANEWVDYIQSRNDTEIVALVDIIPASAKAMAERKNLSAPQFTDISEAIRATGANMVANVTIPEAHRDITMAGLTLGCDVISEKPIANTMAEAEEMVAAAVQSGRTFAVMQNRRFSKGIRALNGWVKDGTLGDIGYVQADFFLGCHFGGFRELMDNPLLLDMAIHTFDEARFITGADPVSVYCHAFNPPGSWYKGNASANCIFEFSNGSVFVYNGSWVTEGCGTSWDANWRVAGTKGTALWDGGSNLFAGIVTGTDGFMRETTRIEGVLDWAGRDAHSGCFDNIFEALNNGTAPETVCTDNIKSAAMLFGALESIRTGQKVQIG